MAANIVLAMFKSDGTRRDFTLSKDRIIIGRKVNCDLRIPLTAVSRQHCEITVDDGKVSVKDLGSSNGTYHNSVRVQEADLAAGDELVIGPVVFTLIVDGQPEDIKPVRTIVNAEGSSEIAASSGKASSSPAAITTEEDIDITEMIEDDEQDNTPTVDLDMDGHDIDDEEDDDPIAALESLANSGAGDDSDEFDDIDFFFDDDED